MDKIDNISELNRLKKTLAFKDKIIRHLNKRHSALLNSIGVRNSAINDVKMLLESGQNEKALKRLIRKWATKEQLKKTKYVNTTYRKI